jgi:hypothetical protein
LRNCEVLYDDFFDHFHRRGFALKPARGKLMVAIFDSQAGFEAYLGRKMPAQIVGIYHPLTNRFVVYDISTNRAVVAQEKKALAAGQRLALDLDRHQYVETVKRQAREFCTGANIGTTMHEVSHQLAFNCGLLNRGGDVPVWLAEGMACYCEPTDRDVWLGIGEPNPERIHCLAARLRTGRPLLPLKDLVAADDWRNDGKTLLLGYAQSWALFRMLMEERPEALRKYLKTVHARRVPDYRLSDFRQAFGPDMSRLEREHAEYVRQLVARFAPRGKW